VTVGVRPEHWRRTLPGDGMPVTARIVEDLGADAYVYGSAVIDGIDHDMIVRVGGREGIARGDVLHAHPLDGDLHVFDGTTGLRLAW